ncbi:hypothetical protein MMC11_008739 [Xylographa trunciseda]|nr:hypothetical protein [Xylographa trunciseda]
MGTVDSKGAPDRCEFYTVVHDEILGVGSQHPAPPVLTDGRGSFKSFMLHSHAVVEHLDTRLESYLHLPPCTLSFKNRLSVPPGTQKRLLKFSPHSIDDRPTSMVAHTDLGTITVLFKILGGLQFLPLVPDNIEKNREFVQPQSACVIISLGDAMVKWTNGLLKSPYHRLTYALGEQANKAWYSVAYLVRPENETPMKRLHGSDIISSSGKGAEEEDITAVEHHYKNSAIHRVK